MTTKLPPSQASTMEQPVAWVAHNTYYFGGSSSEPNEYSSGGNTTLHYYQGYPIPNGYTLPQHKQQPEPTFIATPPTYMYPTPDNPVQQTLGVQLNHHQHQQQQLQQLQRPPRSQRRSTATSGYAPTLNPIRGYTTSVNFDGRDRTGIPDLGEIFPDTQPLLNKQGNENGYGSATFQPIVYNAPPLASRQTTVRSTRTISNGTTPHRLSPVGLPRTNSAGEFYRLSLPISPTSPSHRRISSDSFRDGYRRIGSNEDSYPHHRRQGSRSRSSGGGSSHKRPTHRRADSFSSMRSNVSMGSVISNISKSEFFGGVDEKGRVQMHFPCESVRLVMIDPKEQRKQKKKKKKKKSSLRCGHLYVESGMNDYDQFEEYHRSTEGYMNDTLHWESLDRPGVMLPAPSYVLPVDDTIYKRIVGEISEAHSMPCGIFFCGHHQDVAQPSIAIAAGLVTILLASLVYLAVFTGDL